MLIGFLRNHILLCHNPVEVGYPQRQPKINCLNFRAFSPLSRVYRPIVVAQTLIYIEVPRGLALCTVAISLV